MLLSARLIFNSAQRASKRFMVNVPIPPPQRTIRASSALSQLTPPWKFIIAIGLLCFDFHVLFNAIPIFEFLCFIGVRQHFLPNQNTHFPVAIRMAVWKKESFDGEIPIVIEMARYSAEFHLHIFAFVVIFGAFEEEVFDAISSLA